MPSSGSPFSSFQPQCSLYALNSNGELYWNDADNHLVKSNFNHGTIKYIYNGVGTNGGQGNGCVITTDGKLYYQKTRNSMTTDWVELGAGINWTKAISGTGNGIIIAIGNGKLYKIIPNTSGGDITQLGTSSGYKKIMGNIVSGTGNEVVLAWTGNATETSTTVYTTSNPIANDRTYSDTNLTEYSIVQSCNGTTLTDNYRTYELDISKNSHFNGIPPATAHETVKAIDILRATE